MAANHFHVGADFKGRKYLLISCKGRNVFGVKVPCRLFSHTGISLMLKMGYIGPESFPKTETLLKDQKSREAS